MSRELDSCDRCGKQAEPIHVGWFSETGFDGLCDKCLDEAPRVDTTSSASRQHYVDTGEYLPVDDEEPGELRKCARCGFDISEYAPGLTLCAVCEFGDGA